MSYGYTYGDRDGHRRPTPVALVKPLPAEVGGSAANAG